MLERISFPLILMMLAGTPAIAQSNIKPDSTPRFPSQPGQGLPVEDRQFITRAVNLSDAEIQAGRLAAEKASSEPLRKFGEGAAADHEKLRATIEHLAHKNGIPLQEHASRSTWQSELQRIGGLSGQEFEREYLAWQLQTHLALAELYQTEASNTSETELAKFAITSLNRIQARFDQVKQLGAQQGITINTAKQRPQY